MKLQEVQTFSVRIDRKGAYFVYPLSLEWNAADRAQIPTLAEGREQVIIGETTYRKIAGVVSRCFSKRRTITYSKD